ncbi:SMI1/KNR4 family protein [Lignipirellula cremea]|uniref:Knr4/Smi1-like domain-containing protein n=1 Tax=Lignipirellula cremea TaxID=2528010 RepID=A0A518DSZ8_9BACT|nr:SMI1/KNR4 family protein [Lignipirellula cremea]QDU94971.1 hypothetical protein Pla8534_27800 [Lignipirellula cremea]
MRARAGDDIGAIAKGLFLKRNGFWLVTPRPTLQRSSEEQAFLEMIALAETPGDELLVYADWLEDRGDPAAGLLRHHYYMLQLSPANPILPTYVKEEERLKRLCDRKWWKRYEEALGPAGDFLFWKRLYARKTILLDAEERIARLADREESLRLCERELGFTLPQSYKTFLAVFGPAEIGGFFRVLAPYSSSSLPEAWDLIEANRWIRTSQAWTQSHTAARVRELILFSQTSAGDQFFWDAANLTSKATGEYAIYIQSRSEPTGQLQYLTSTFRRYVRSICLGTGFLRVAGGIWRRARPPQCIAPQLREKIA